MGVEGDWIRMMVILWKQRYYASTDLMQRKKVYPSSSDRLWTVAVTAELTERDVNQLFSSPLQALSITAEVRGN